MWLAMAPINISNLQNRNKAIKANIQTKGLQVGALFKLSEGPTSSRPLTLL